MVYPEKEFNYWFFTKLTIKKPHLGDSGVGYLQPDDACNRFALPILEFKELVGKIALVQMKNSTTDIFGFQTTPNKEKQPSYFGYFFGFLGHFVSVFLEQTNFGRANFEVFVGKFSNFSPA